MGVDDWAPNLRETGERRAVAHLRHLGDRMRRFVAAHPIAPHAAAAGAIFLVAVLNTALPDPSALTSAALATAVVVSAGFVVVPAMGWPAWLIPAIATAGAIAAMPTGAADAPGRSALVLAMLLFALRSGKAAVIATAIAATGSLLLAGSVVAAVQDHLVVDNVVVVPWVVAAAALGQAIRANLARRAMLEERARRAEQSREDEARRRVQAERLRIARELHDAVGHQVALINVQAGAMALLLAGNDLTRARESLEHIHDASEAALEELRLAVGLLRQPGEDDPVEPAGRLSRLAELIASFTATGLRVSCHVTGPERPLPDAVDLTAYRLIQESLTNTAKHAAGTSASVRLAFRPETLALTVEDDGPPSRGPTARPPSGDEAGPMGHGIIGMRERAAALGGRFSAGPRPEGGFQVSAELPTPAGAGS